MPHDSPDMTALGAPLSPGQPGLRRLCAIRADIGSPTEFTTTQGHGRALFPILGGQAVAADWSATILPGGADVARRLEDGAYEVEARYILQLDDGTPVMVMNAGRMVPQPDGSYHGRTRATLEVPDGPHRALGNMVLFGTAFSGADDPDHVYIELWHATI
ncbi:MAG: DUF3237 family protein [Paracoccaceae bacterium]